MNINETLPRAASTTQQQYLSNNFIANTKSKITDVQQPRKGTVTDAQQMVDESGIERVYVMVRLDEKLNSIQQSSYPSQGFVLAHTIGELALAYGGLKELIGLSVMIQGNGARLDQGIATIVNASGEGNLDKANTLKSFGTLLAPAGNSF